MARCPKCRRHFRTLEDEEGMHECPHCGYDGHDGPTCVWCGDEYTDEEYEPYCSPLCTHRAETDDQLTD